MNFHPECLPLLIKICYNKSITRKGEILGTDGGLYQGIPRQLILENNEVIDGCLLAQQHLPPGEIIEIEVDSKTSTYVTARSSVWGTECVPHPQERVIKLKEIPLLRGQETTKLHAGDDLRVFLVGMRGPREQWRIPIGEEPKPKVEYTYTYSSNTESGAPF